MRTASLNVKFLRTAILLILISLRLPCYPQNIPLPNAFAHNDYWHKHPLRDALDNGYTHIEADIFLRGGKLVVAHFFPFFKKNRTLEKLYLEPLFEQVQKNGQVFDGYNTPITLMIDIKSGAESTYKALKAVLEKYRPMLSSYENGHVRYGLVTIVLSGHKPYQMVKSENSRLVFIDEDLRKIGRDSSLMDVYPMASCKYTSILNWKGKGVLPAVEKDRLCKLINTAHSMGKKVRLWASPENKVVWEELLNCGVDLINTDQLVTLKNFLNTSFANSKLAERKQLSR
ncbi:phosphatidylinositol-specific phospholipase C/glycerophosphodiester phosphodiesterase family protein [Mucilaginibacter gynuensis]|uniref:Altered inheritance of mitochondria protein 6 n=1 Tax=Mucilaginibacter gynuensis TaxID=1302236 RepID=A0ABP8GP32_9SPHI